MSKLTTSRSALSGALGQITRVIERRNNITILSNVALELEGNTLHLRGTDLDIDMRTSIAVDGAGDGTTTLNADRLHQVVRTLPADAAVTLEWDSNSPATLKSGRSRFVLPSLPLSDFPDLATGQMTNLFSMPAAALARIIEKVAFAISVDETRFYLQGIYFHPVTGDAGMALRGVATDGHRMAVAEAPLPNGAESMAGIIVPKKTVDVLGKLLSGHKEDVDVQVSPAKLVVQVGATRIVSKLIDGTFPDYQRVIPTRNDKHATLELASLHHALQRAAVFYEDKGSKVVNLTFKEGALELYKRDSEGGELREEIEIDYDSAELRVGVNVSYFRDAVDVPSGDCINIALSDPGSAALITSPTEADLRIVLMPMRTDKEG